MADVTTNKERWDGDYDWEAAGEEWSRDWGNSSFEWWGTLFPRIQRFLPASRILEIAPGYGRWTHYLNPLCDELIGVDLSGECIVALNERFSGQEKMSFYQNDGKSLDMVEDDSIDFAFSFGSLVHVESDVMYSYLEGLSRVLNKDGVAFLHHSNIASIPLLEARSLNRHWRGETSSGSVVRGIAESLDLNIIAQEMAIWTNVPGLLSDCFTLLTKKGSAHAREEAAIASNYSFNEEQARLKALSEIYPSSK
jgi:SAM-dependent methyltransferase